MYLFNYRLKKTENYDDDDDDRRSLHVKNNYVFKLRVCLCALEMVVDLRPTEAATKSRLFSWIICLIVLTATSTASAWTSYPSYLSDLLDRYMMASQWDGSVRCRCCADFS